MFKLYKTGVLNSAIQRDDAYIFLEIWRFEKHIALSEKMPPLVCHRCQQKITAS